MFFWHICLCFESFQIINGFVFIVLAPPTNTPHPLERKKRSATKKSVEQKESTTSNKKTPPHKMIWNGSNLIWISILSCSGYANLWLFCTWCTKVSFVIEHRYFNFNYCCCCWQCKLSPQCIYNNVSVCVDSTLWMVCCVSAFRPMCFNFTFKRSANKSTYENCIQIRDNFAFPSFCVVLSVWFVRNYRGFWYNELCEPLLPRVIEESPQREYDSNKKWVQPIVFV